MNPLEYISQSEKLHTREVNQQEKINAINSEIFSLESEISALESEKAVLYSELSSAMSMADEDGNYNYSLVSAIEAEISAIDERIEQC
ncbi:MAG: hypothetical protein K2J39_10745, partial [Ruminococcus sp.]|nr:hypothetical protein [Ruminococcus sp.]